MNNNKESDKTYLVTSLIKDTNNEIEAFDTSYCVFNSLNDAKKHYKQLINCNNIYSANISQVIESTDYHQTRADYITYGDKKLAEYLAGTGKEIAKIVDEPKETDDDGCLDSCSNNEGKCPNGYVCELHEDERDEPKEITNDFDYWINKLVTVEEEITDWLSNNTDELYDEEPDIDSCRNNLQEAIQDIHNHKASNTIAVPTSKCVNAILDYILFSEMGGTYDAKGPWHWTYQLLMELRNDKIDPDELSYVSTNPSLQS